MATNITVIFLVAMVNVITKATDVPMLTFGTTVMKVQGGSNMTGTDL